MKCISFIDEQDIIDNLHLESSTVIRRKTEDQLFRKYYYMVKVGAKKYALHEDDAFNAYSDTVLAVINTIAMHTFEGRCSLRTYLHGIYHHKCIDVVRKKAARKNDIHRTVPIGEAEMLLSGNSKSIIEKLIMKSEADMLKQMLDQLSYSSKQVLLLFAEGHTDKEIAEVLQYKTAGVAKTTRLRCQRKLCQFVTQKMC